MSAFPRPSTLRVEEYLQFDRSSAEARYEYIDGQMTLLAGGTLNHATVSLNVASLLRNLLRGHPYRVFSSDARVQLAETRYVYPDVTVSCDRRDRGQTDIIQSPRVVVEVLSPSTEDYDRGRKFSYYRQCPSMQEYVLIDIQQQTVEVCRREKKDLWSFHAYGVGDDLELLSLGVQIPIVAMYEDVEFPSQDGDAPA